jgi:hypothetical protein
MLLEEVESKKRNDVVKLKPTTIKNLLSTQRKVLFGTKMNTQITEKKKGDQEMKIDAILGILQDLTQRVSHQGETITSIATGVQDTLTVVDKTQGMVGDGKEDNKDAFKLQSKQLAELKSEIRNIPNQYGCSGRNTSGLLKCVLSLFVFVIKAIEYYTKMHIFAISVLKQMYTDLLSPVPLLGSCIIMILNLFLVLLHVYLANLIVVAIGICTGNPTLCMDIMRLTLRFTIKIFELMIRSFPTNVWQDMKNTGVMARTEFVNSAQIGPAYVHLETNCLKGYNQLVTSFVGLQSLDSNLRGIGNVAAYTTSTIYDVTAIATEQTVVVGNAVAVNAAFVTGEFFNGMWNAIGSAQDAAGGKFAEFIGMNGGYRSRRTSNNRIRTVLLLKTKKKGGGKNKLKQKVGKKSKRRRMKSTRKQQDRKEIYDKLTEIVKSFRVVSPWTADNVFIKSHVKLAELLLHSAMNFSEMALSFSEAVNRLK